MTSTNSGGRPLDLNRLQNLKGKVNSRLQQDVRTSNKKMIKEFLKENKNPILSAIKHLIKTQGKNGKLADSYYVNMLPIQIMQLMDPVMQEKVWVDLDREIGPIENRKNLPFH